MRYLLDINLLLRLIVPEHPLHPVTDRAVDSLKADKNQLFIAPQNMIELWNVATRPVDKNGLGYELARTKQEVSQLIKLFTLLPDLPDIYPVWERLVSEHKVKGVNVHDTRLVAFMLVHGISHLLTFNTKDFQRFNYEITIVHPENVGK